MPHQTIFITGASAGIGRALALQLAKRGAHVAIAARRTDLLEQLAHEIRAKGGGAATVVPLDVSDPEAAKEAVSKVERDLGALDMVIANAGTTSRELAVTLSWEEVTRVLDVNLRGALATIVAAIPIFVAQERGHIVGVSSLAGFFGFPNTRRIRRAKRRSPHFSPRFGSISRRWAFTSPTCSLALPRRASRIPLSKLR